MCFVWIWEQTAIISLYSIDWLVFITETECVYCAVRSTFYVLPTQCIYVFCVDLRTYSDYFTVQHWLVGFYNWDGVCLLRGTFYVLRSAHTVYLCVLCGSENRQPLSHSKHWLVGFYNRDGECLLRGTDWWGLLIVHKPGFNKTHSLFLRNRAATNRITFVWNVTPCSPLERNHFRVKPLPQTSNLKMEATCPIETS